MKNLTYFLIIDHIRPTYLRFFFLNNCSIGNHEHQLITQQFSRIYGTKVIYEIIFE